MMSSPARRSSLNGSSGANHNSRSDFATALKKWSTPIPPVLSRKLGRVSESPLGKVKVMLRICENSEDGSGILGIDSRRKQVTLIDPGGNASSGITPEERRVGVSAPKMFAFDGIFGDDDDQAEICGASAAELVASVVGGEDGCFVSLGSSSTGKKQTMFGKPANQKMGVVPTTISWLFKSIQEQKQKAGSRFSIRVSALTVTGGSGHELINDLLLPFANDGDQPPGAYLTSNGQATSNSGNKLPNTTSLLSTVSEVRAASPEKAGFFFDTALESMKTEDHVRHFIFTLHVYQYMVDKNGKGVIGGRSRLHCVKLGNGSPSISVLGGLLLAVLNGQRHLPSRDSKLGAILRECLGSLTCRAVVMIHVSNAHSRYAETLTALQLGSRVHRLRRSRRLKMGSVGSGNGSGGSSGGSGEEMRNGSGLLVTTSGGPSIGATICEGETGSSDIDPSSSEQSCDTVIYLGPSIDDATDGENPPIYLPSLDTETGIETKIQLSKSSIPSSIPPKTKSPKPKSNTKHHNGNYTQSTTPKGEEQWVDGPNVSKYHHTTVGTHSNGNTHNITKKSETWIDGPAAAALVNHQANNFPSPKKSVQTTRDSLLPSVPTISSVKAQMIQQWISNQTHSHLPFDDGSLLDVSMYLPSNGKCHHQCQYFPNHFPHLPLGDVTLNGGHGHEIPVEPEYKSLTVFKTCEDEYFDEEENYPCNGFEFEFIEVIEPEIPVPTRDACLQVTEEDIALSFLEENPLPESDQNFTMGNDAYYFVTSASQLSPKKKDEPTSIIHTSHNAHTQSLTQLLQPTLPIQSFSSPLSSLASVLTLTEKNDDHPLRALSQECLTVVSTFTDSMSLNGDFEKFWPRLSLVDDPDDGKNNGSSHFHHHNHGLCKNLASLSQMSLVADENPNLGCIYTTTPTSSTNDEPGILSPLSTVRKNYIKSSEITMTASMRPKVVIAPTPPVLSDESIFKIPMSLSGSVAAIKKTNAIGHERASHRESDAEESVIIPPMKLLDLTPITSNVETIGSNLSPKTGMVVVDVNRGCDHNHHQLQQTQNIIGQGSNGITSPTNGTLVPPPPPPELLLTKSPCKSKSRKIAKFFRGRSKSPKKIGSAMSSSESGKSSGSSTVSGESKLSSSSGGSSCSSANSPLTNKSNSTNNNVKSFKYHQMIHHPPPSPKKTISKNQPIYSTPPGTTMDYHFNCDSGLSTILPSPTKEGENGVGRMGKE